MTEPREAKVDKRLEDGTNRQWLVIEVDLSKVRTLEQTRIIKADLDACISVLIKNFETRTMCPVMKIEDRGQSDWRTEVQL